jgi:hypothetical protein
MRREDAEDEAQGWPPSARLQLAMTSCTSLLQGIKRPPDPAGTYCPGMVPAAPVEFGTCLGDLYSVAWMENADHANLTVGGWGGGGWDRLDWWRMAVV